MPEQLGKLRIKDREFSVAEATLSGRLQLSGPVEWFLEVNAQEKEYEGEVWSPKAYVERYPSSARSMSEFIATPIVIQDGMEFCDRTILPDGRLCCLYVFEHDWLDDNLIEFARDEASRCSVVWTARCGVHWNEEYGDGLELRIETIVDFLGFAVGTEDETQANRLLAEKFDPQGLRFHKEPGRDGSFFLPVVSKA